MQSRKRVSQCESSPPVVVVCKLLHMSAVARLERGGRRMARLSHQEPGRKADEAMPRGEAVGGSTRPNPNAKSNRQNKNIKRKQNKNPRREKGR